MHYAIAGLLVDMEPHGKTRKRAEAYRVTGQRRKADLTFRMEPEEALRLEPELITGDDAEYMITGDMFYVGLLHHEGLLLHASSILYRGEAVCFSAPPGTGKSTHTEKWVRLFGAEYLNDDKPALRYLDGRWTAWGTPWSGKHDLSRNCGAPLRAICFLRRGEENRMERLTPAEALPRLLSQTTHQLRRPEMELLLGLCDRLLREVPVWQLTCRNEDEAAFVARTALFPEAEN